MSSFSLDIESYHRRRTPLNVLVPREQEMIHLPIVRHVRRLLACAVIFGTAVLLMLWLPVGMLRALWPSFLPYTVSLHTEAQVNELSLELLLLQVSASQVGS